MKVQVVWAGDLTTQNAYYDGPRIFAQMFNSGQPGPRGGRPALVIVYDEAGQQTQVVQFADAYQVIKTIEP